MNVIHFESPPPADQVPTELYRRNCLPGGGSAIVARTDLVRAAGGFSTEFTDLADWDLWLRLIRLAPLAVVPHFQIAYTFGIFAPSHTRPTRSLEEMSRLRVRHRFGVGGNPDFDRRNWNRWIWSQYWRTRDRSAMSRLWWREALRTRSPVDFGRSVGYRLLPIAVQVKIRRARLSRLIRTLDPVDVQTVEGWLADIADASLTLPM